MKIRVQNVIPLTLSVLFFASAAQAQQVYTIGDRGQFGSLNVLTGSYLRIGTVTASLGGLGIGADGNLYGLDNGRSLYRVNTATGATSLIGNTGLTVGGGWGLGNTSDGTLYAFTQSIQLYTVNSTTAATTFVGTMGFISGGNFAGDASGNLYSSQGGQGTGFYKLSRTNAASTLLGNLTGTVYGLAFTNGGVYALNTVGGIYSINTSTGVATQTANYDNGVVGQVFAAATAPNLVIVASPEASSLLLWMSGAGVGFLLWRRRGVATR